MLKKTIEYENLDGDKVAKEFHFNLSKAELLDMKFGKQDGGSSLEEYIREIGENNDSSKILEAFRYIIKISVGQRVGDNFIKSEAITSDLLDSPAYSELLFELATNSESTVQFIRAVVPRSISDQLTDKDLLVEIKNADVVAIPDEVGVKPIKTELKHYSHKELLEMPHAQFEMLAGKDPRKMDQDIFLIAMQRKMGRENE